LTGWIDAHHHLWDLSAVEYPWLMARGTERFFGDPSPIQKNYIIEDFRADAAAQNVRSSVHIQVGAADAHAEAQWVQKVAEENPDWPLAQVVFCDLTDPNLDAQLDAFLSLPTVRGVRQIVGRAPGEDAETGTNTLLDNPRFLEGLIEVGRRGLRFDLQLIPELMEKTALILNQSPETEVSLCHAGSPHDRSTSGLDEWARVLISLSSQRQITCKLSGLGMFDHNWTAASIAPIIETCLEQFGADRVMFGSNFPVDKLYSDYATLIGAFREILPDEMHEQVFNRTASRFYKL